MMDKEQGIPFAALSLSHNDAFIQKFSEDKRLFIGSPIWSKRKRRREEKRKAQNFIASYKEKLHMYIKYKPKFTAFSPFEGKLFPTLEKNV